MMSQALRRTRQGHPPSKRRHPNADQGARFTVPNEPLVYGVIGFILVLVLWEVVVDVGLAKASLLSSPTRIWTAAVADFGSGVIWPQISTSLLEWIVGFVLAIVVGIPVGLALGQVQRLEFLVEPWIYGLYATPSVALAPLLILIFGVGVEAKFAIVFLEGVITLLISTIAGSHAADRRHMEIAQSFGASRSLTFRSVTLPSSVPFIITGLRIAAGRALVGVIVAEFIAANVGLGFYISLNGTTLNSSRVMLGILLLGVFGIAVGQLIQRVERRFERWRPAIH
ncbi:MAG TPA: ABC transporter permease [Candidatus Limnocylindrales bacterium]|nr:ABC transporter permease [Candidatus Limnocylindrales bacterium]